MKNNNKKHNKRVKKLMFIVTIFAIVIMASTYAWFIGMKTVNVSSFDIEIATTEGLFLSMNGKDWYYNLDAKNVEAYENNTNTWAEKGLIPMSSVGDMDANSSTMRLFEKGSLTATKGGYRLLASRVHNYDKKATESAKFYEEGNGYVAFDLFIKNMSGREYYDGLDLNNEEAIYLTTNSEVKVGSAGVANTGIENSVRVAFTQIGRVVGDSTDQSLITGITCKDDETGSSKVTGICRNAQIWEPNETRHVTNAINWFNKSCLNRKTDGTDIYKAESYDTTSCTSPVDNTRYDTFVVSRDIVVSDNVDVYDGSYNGYTANTVDYATYSAADDTTKAGYKLVNSKTFTDEMKMRTGNARPEFIYLAPNSITKLRVYIYIEGQDIDNYDFASLGKQISVNFGFTKERFTEGDIDYTGPSTDITPTDTTPVTA